MDGPGSSPFPHAGRDPDNVIVVDNLFKSFGTKEVLKGVNFTVKRGEVLVVIGKSGSGKSVIFKHLTALLRPDSGAVYLEGNNIFELDDQELYLARKKFGVAFQLSALFDSLTIYDNVAFGLRRMHLGTDFGEERIREKVTESLAMVGLKGVENKMPVDVSGGMQKRVAIARAIAYEPQIILYDEPTTGLDPITAAAVDDLIMGLNKELGITSIVVSHDMASVFKIAARITMLYQGQMIMTGYPDQFQSTDHPVVRQFISGTQDGPMRVI